MGIKNRELDNVAKRELAQILMESEVLRVIVDGNNSSLNPPRAVVTLHDADGNEFQHCLSIVGTVREGLELADIPENDKFAALSIMARKEPPYSVPISSAETEIMDEMRKNGGNPILIGGFADLEEIKAIAEGISPKEYRKKKEKEAEDIKSSEEKAQRDEEEYWERKVGPVTSKRGLKDNKGENWQR